MRIMKELSPIIFVVLVIVLIALLLHSCGTEPRAEEISTSQEELLWGPGVNGGSQKEGEPCNSFRFKCDAADNLACHDGRCAQARNEGEGCNWRRYCRNDLTCFLGRCRADECDADEECGEGLAYCRKPRSALSECKECQFDAQCAPEQTCRGNTCRSILKENGEWCRADAECQSRACTDFWIWPGRCVDP